MTKATASTWSALRNPTFRNLWIASLVSGTCVAAHDTAATWVMNTLTASPFLISLMSTVASLPFLIFTLPAGALADMVDRKKLLVLMNLWLTIAAAVSGDPRMDSSSQYLCHPDCRVSDWSRLRICGAGLGFDRS